MKVSVAWLDTLCDVGLAPAALAERLTLQGLETGTPAPVPAPPAEIVAARFAEVRPIARTNYLHIQADAGAAGRFGVVSAAPNIVQGMVGVIALPGATLPDGRVIATHEYAGIRSEAMLCSTAELGLGEASDRLLELPDDAAPGTPLAVVYGLPDATIEIDVTANRGDCLSMAGIARELHASSGAPLTLPATDAVTPAHEERERIEIAAPEACPRYLGRVVTGLDPNARTPLWLAERLRRVGQRTSHPVVDVLNYVMLELGQPLHAFDREKIAGTIVVRRARAGERVTLLTGTEAVLAEDMLVIADANGPIALAGVMGGADSAVSSSTRSIFIESAWFAPAAVRGRARRLGLASEASLRYERGVDPELPRAALERASALLREIAGGAPGPMIAVESLAQLPVRAPIAFHPDVLHRLLGFSVEPAECERILVRLGFTVETWEQELFASPPSARFDAEGEADLVEEIARIAGYAHIPAVAPRRCLAAPRINAHKEASVDELAERLAALLVARGYDEAVTLSLVAPERDAAFAPVGSAPLVLENPLSEHESVLRRSLWPGLLAALARNVSRQAERVRLFETGTVFDAEGGEHQRLAVVVCGTAAPEQWALARRSADFYDLKGDLESLLAAVGAEAPEFVSTKRAGLAPGRAAQARIAGKPCAELGVLHPTLAARWSLPPETLLLELDFAALARPTVAQAQVVPRFPPVRRDLALVVPAGISAARLRAGARRNGGKRLAETRIFDVYTGPGIPDGARSIGLGLIFRDFCRTLTDAEVDAAVSAIVTGLAKEADIHVRD
ncbi:MAG: phenylalanine--tRNA ligase subunit beta [Gammaproteobacteria bacterium]